MGKVIINGKTYDSLTGLQIRDENLVEVKTETAAVVPAVKVSPAPTPIIANVAPRPKRVSKQERLAAAVAQEFASEKKTRREVSSKPAHAEPQTIAVASNSPSWIANYVEGHNPIEITPIRIASEQSRRHSRSTVEHRGRHSLQRSQTLNRRFVKKPVTAPHVAVARPKTVTIDKHPSVHRFAPITVKAADSVETPKASPEKVTVRKVVPDTPFTPVVSHKAAKKLVAAKPQPTTLAGSDLKDFLIKSQLDQPVDKKARQKADEIAKET